MPSSLSRASILPLIVSLSMPSLRGGPRTADAISGVYTPPSRLLRRCAPRNDNRRAPRNRRIRCLAPQAMRALWTVLLCLILLPGAAPAATLGEARIGFTADRTLVI